VELLAPGTAGKITRTESLVAVVVSPWGFVLLVTVRVKNIALACFGLDKVGIVIAAEIPALVVNCATAVRALTVVPVLVAYDSILVCKHGKMARAPKIPPFLVV
jgi:hypothetical protein